MRFGIPLRPDLAELVVEVGNPALNAAASSGLIWRSPGPRCSAGSGMRIRPRWRGGQHPRGPSNRGQLKAAVSRGVKNEAADRGTSHARWPPASRGCDNWTGGVGGPPGLKQPVLMIWRRPKSAAPAGTGHRKCSPPQRREARQCCHSPRSRRSLAMPLLVAAVTSNSRSPTMIAVFASSLCSARMWAMQIGLVIVACRRARGREWRRSERASAKCSRIGRA